MNAVLFVGHGSKDQEGNQEVRNFIDSIIPGLKVPIIETCFLEFEEPGVIEGLEACVQRGASHIAVIPMMLFAAGHAKIHIPAAMDEMRLKNPQVKFSYGRPIGIHEQVLDILSARLEESGIGGEQKDGTAVLIVGRGSSDPDANSDLYKMSRLFQERSGFSMVETAFMGVTAPLLDDGIDRCRKLGASHVVVLPYFLFTGVLIKRMEKMVRQFQEKFPQLNFTLADYFGYHPYLREVFKDRAGEALGGAVSMNCDTCQYRLAAKEHLGHHHHHHDEHHNHHHHDEHHNHHDHDHDHDHSMVDSK